MESNTDGPLDGSTDVIEVVPTCWYCGKDRKPGADCPCGAPAEMPEHWAEDYR